jgi:hypothetical protein
VAECLNMLVLETRSEVTTEHIDRVVFEFAIDYARDADVMPNPLHVKMATSTAT